MLDWKTGVIYTNHAAQLGAYALAYSEMTGEPVATAYAIHSSLGELTAHKVLDINAASNLFVALLRTRNQWDLVGFV